MSGNRTATTRLDYCTAKTNAALSAYRENLQTIRRFFTDTAHDPDRAAATTALFIAATHMAADDLARLERFAGGER